MLIFCDGLISFYILLISLTLLIRLKTHDISIFHSPLEPKRPPPPSAPPMYTSPFPATNGVEASIKRKARVLYDYDAADPSELSLLADEVCAFLFVFLL